LRRSAVVQEVTVANLYKKTGKSASWSGQAALVDEAFDVLGAADGHQIAEWLDKCDRFKSRQTSTRIAFYYITVMAKLGVIEMVDADAKYPAMERVGALGNGLLIEVTPDTKSKSLIVLA
jgi:hypothetical protein